MQCRAETSCSRVRDGYGGSDGTDDVVKRCAPFLSCTSAWRKMDAWCISHAHAADQPWYCQRRESHWPGWCWAARGMSKPRGCGRGRAFAAVMSSLKSSAKQSVSSSSSSSKERQSPSSASSSASVESLVRRWSGGGGGRRRKQIGWPRDRVLGTGTEKAALKDHYERLEARARALRSKKKIKQELLRLRPAERRGLQALLAKLGSQSREVRRCAVRSELPSCGRNWPRADIRAIIPTRR